ncbi:MAG TPA: cytochrome b [Chromatiales bacterium]|nr:cytochrome b [Chromatiales bacterium]
MQIRNNVQSYGAISIGLHWVMALLILGLIALGAYMVEMDYYNPWYQKAPDLHRSLGVTTGLLSIIRLAWRLANPLPAILGRKWERQVAVWVHRTFYLLLAAVVISGYLITTATGQGVSVFGWFELPAMVYGLEQQEEIAGNLHRILAYGVLGLTVLHSLAALKHHFIDRDATLMRMLRVERKPPP